MIEFIFKGIIVGLSVSIPLGPVGVLVIQRTMSKGWFAGLFSGLGATFADTFYAIIAGFGVKFISDFMMEHQIWLRLIGSVFLLFMGIRISRSHIIQQMRTQMRNPPHSKYLTDLVSMFFLTISNPLTIIAYGAIFAGLGLVEGEMGVRATNFLILGVFSGAVLWWMILGTTINFFRNKIRLRNLFWINKITGIVIAILGVLAGLSVFFIK